LQIVYYFYGYLRVCNDECDEVVTFSVPTGGCGNLAAGFVAQRMGLPIKLLSCTNQNDVVHHCIQNGELMKKENYYVTYSCSMDIQEPTNIERILYYLSNENSSEIERIMEEFYQTGFVTIPAEYVEKLNGHVYSHCVTDEEVKRTIVEVWEKHQYIIDPHTAVGIYGAMNHRHLSEKMICFAPASPHKFPDLVKELGIPLQTPELILNLNQLETKSIDLNKGENWEEILREKIISIDNHLNENFN